MPSSDHILACVDYGLTTRLQAIPYLHLELALPCLGGFATREVWFSPEKVRHDFDQQQQIIYTHNSEVLIGALWIDEAVPMGFDAPTFSAYRRIHQFLGNQSLGSLLRVWNYFPGITMRAGSGHDRYQLFCLGRHQAIKDIPGVPGILPAATGIGTHAPGFLIYFLAARHPGWQVENPRQISAFHYPEYYAVRSPSFSRATLKIWAHARHLYISGTASIVGHRSLHQENLEAQIDEILLNLQALLDQAGERFAWPLRELAEVDLYKVYVRHSHHALAVRRQLRQRLGKAPAMICLQGDICRDDLLVEIEAFAAAPATIGAP